MRSMAPAAQADTHSAPAAGAAAGAAADRAPGTGGAAAPAADALSAATAAASPALAAQWAHLDTPQQWLAYLRTLVGAGRLDDARRSAVEFKRRWPDAVLPEDLARALVRTP